MVLFLCTGNYYRSRFAELVFNALAPAAGLRHCADSAGLAPRCHTRNPGPISPHALRGLAERGIACPLPHRLPRDVTFEDFVRAELVIALKDGEHRPMVEGRFPEHLGRVRFWRVDDVDEAAPAQALAEIEDQVRALVAELGGL